MHSAYTLGWRYESNCYITNFWKFHKSLVKQSPELDVLTDLFWIVPTDFNSQHGKRLKRCSYLMSYV